MKGINFCSTSLKKIILLLFCKHICKNFKNERIKKQILKYRTFGRENTYKHYKINYDTEIIHI